MKKEYDLNFTISSILNGLYLDEGFVNVNGKQFDVNSIMDCIIKYYSLEEYYDFSNKEINDNLFEILKPLFEEYNNGKLINIQLTEELKEKLNNCDNKEIHRLLKKYMQNRLTNKNIIKYVKKVIDDKNLYIYDKYINMTKEEAIIAQLKISKILNILNTIDYQINEFGIKYKSIHFDINSEEYMTLCPSINMDKYDISFYERVLNLLNDKINK